jgi:hypothetical protein
MTATRASNYLLGEPQVAGPLTIFPVFGPEPRLPYRGLAAASARGAYVAELDDGGIVNDVRVVNASDRALLLYEGELITGGQQDRTVDQPVLVPAGVELTVPVSCVEHGRWHHDGHGIAKFRPGDAADPGLRAVKRATANRRAAAGGPARPDQGQVWDEVAQRLDTLGIQSSSAALSDVFVDRGSAIDALRRPIEPVEGQTGAVVMLLDRPIALDLVSRPEVFAELLPRLATGYALQALTLSSPAFGPETDPGVAEGFLESVLTARRGWLPTPGMGEAFSPRRQGLVGCGLRSESELIALSVFPARR